MFGEIPEENLLGIAGNSVSATVHSANKDIQKYILVTEKQIDLINGNEDLRDVTHYFHKLIIKKPYKEITDTFAKYVIIEYLCTKKSATHFPDDSDFLLFQQAKR